MPSLLEEACSQLREALQQRSGPARAFQMERALELYHWALDEQRGQREGEREDAGAASGAEGHDPRPVSDEHSPDP